MKLFMVTIVLLAGLNAQARGWGDAGSAGNTQPLFILPQGDSFLSLKPYNKNDDRHVAFSVNPNLVIGNLRCGDFSCFVDLQVSGSDLIAVVEAAKEPMDRMEKRITKKFKIATIRGDRVVDFSAPHKVSIQGKRSARLFCLDFNIPTIGSSGKCKASSGHYNIELF